MGSRASGSFTIDAWDDDPPYDEQHGVVLGRVRVTKTFSGDVVGTSRTDLITVVTAAGPRAYVGVERVAGSVHGRSGSFVLQHSATSGGDEDGLSWTVVRTPVRAS